MSDNKFALGIHNAVNVCMNVSSDDRVLITTDLDAHLIGEALSNKSLEVGAKTKIVILEDFGPRPLTFAPEALIQEYVDFKPTVTFYTAGSQEGEIQFRRDMGAKSRQAFIEQGIPAPRHGHMVSITPRLIEEGMTADYTKISMLTHHISEIVQKAKTIHVTSIKGTDLTATFNPDYKWITCHGLYHQPEQRGNLPEGEVFTCPDSVNGTLVADVLGDYFSPKYGVLDTPVTVEIRDSIAEEIYCNNPKIKEELWDYLNSAENGRRVGEFAIGTNTAVTELTGNLLQDEKIPGIHIAFGNPYGNRTGAEWSSKVHVDLVPEGCTIMVDDLLLMKDGKFLV